MKIVVLSERLMLICSIILGCLAVPLVAGLKPTSTTGVDTRSVAPTYRGPASLEFIRPKSLQLIKPLGTPDETSHSVWRKEPVRIVRKLPGDLGYAATNSGPTAYAYAYELLERVSAWERSPYFDGPLTRGGDSLLLVSGEVPQRSEDVGGGDSLWLFGKLKSGRWGQIWYHRVGEFAIFEGLRAFWQAGDRRKQIAVYVGGVDWQGMEVFGFRGEQMQPVTLAVVGHTESCVFLLHRGGGVQLVERAILTDLLKRRSIPLPLPPLWRGHVFAMRRYAYSPKSGTYKVVKDWYVDSNLERLLPPRIRSVLAAENVPFIGKTS